MVHPLQGFACRGRHDRTRFADVHPKRPPVAGRLAVPLNRVVNEGVHQGAMLGLGEHAVDGLGPDGIAFHGQPRPVLEGIQQLTVQACIGPEGAVMHLMERSQLRWGDVVGQHGGRNDGGGLGPFGVDHLSPNAHLMTERAKHLHHHVWIRNFSAVHFTGLSRGPHQPRRIPHKRKSAHRRINCASFRRGAPLPRNRSEGCPSSLSHGQRAWGPAPRWWVAKRGPLRRRLSS